ncbi:MAG TPA: hypothetical protein PK961_15335 [bacterium]|nr:hypothetical protein [bacterium]
MGWWRKAFAVERAEDFAPDERERQLIDAFAAKICRHGLAVPAILFLESARPLNFIGSQALAFFEPIVRGLLDWQAYSDFAHLLERRGSVEALLAAIENCEAERSAIRAAARRKRKKGKKTIDAEGKQRDAEDHRS